jgi:hypothetical protein
MKYLSLFLGQKNVLILILFCGFIAQNAVAQEVQVNESPQVAALFKHWANANRVNPKVEGWRVQIMAGTDRQQVEEGRNRFRQAYPEVPADWTHEKPYYKLRVGAFRTKQEALAFISTLQGFPGAYPAKDPAIHPRDFLSE